MKRYVGVVGVSVAVAGVVAAALASGGAAVAADGDGPEVQSSLVEDYAYPGADAILAEHGLKVFKGDGHVELVSSSGTETCEPGLIQVETLYETEPYGAYYCFRTSGARGFLTLEVPNTFLLRGGDEAVEATARLRGGTEETYEVPPNTSVEVEPGNGSDMPVAILVELRFGAW